jgi:hypothetical protein
MQISHSCRWAGTLGMLGWIDGNDLQLDQCLQGGERSTYILWR